MERLTPLERQDLYECLQRGDELDSYTATIEKMWRIVDRGESTAEHDRAEAWRVAAKRLYDAMGEGGKGGRPMDCIDKKTWRWILEGIAIAEASEPSPLRAIS